MPEILFLLSVGWSESGKAILNETIIYLQCNQFQFVDSMLFSQVRWANFFRALSKYFFGKIAQPPGPLEKLVRTPMRKRTDKSVYTCMHRDRYLSCLLIWVHCNELHCTAVFSVYRSEERLISVPYRSTDSDNDIKVATERSRRDIISLSLWIRFCPATSETRVDRLHSGVPASSTSFCYRPWLSPTSEHDGHTADKSFHSVKPATWLFRKTSVVYQSVNQSISIFLQWLK